MNNLYILQDRNYGLGNFINLTPTLKAMFDLLGEPIPVYFELEHVKKCFLDCEFIKILEKQPFDKPLFSSAMVDVRNHLPDWVFVYRELSKRYSLNPEVPHTYIDTAKEIPKRSNPLIDDNVYTLFMYGSGNEEKQYMNLKTPDKSYYEEFMKGKCIFTGSGTDYYREHWFDNMEYYIDDIRKSLSLIRDATLIISNDTGLAHAAGAMNKELIILWKDTMLPKNGNPGKNTTIKLVR